MAVVNFTYRTNRGLSELKENREIWFSHPNFPNFLIVSNFGNIRTKTRIVKLKQGQTKIVKGDYAKTYIIKRGYLIIKVPDEHNETRLTHRLVLETFSGPCPEGWECRHLDGSKTNNRLDNLCWSTKKDNQSDRVIHGTDLNGEKAYNAAFSRTDIQNIHDEYESGLNYKEIAKKRGVSAHIIGRIIRGDGYKYSQPDNPAKIRPRNFYKGLRSSRAKPLTYNGETKTMTEWAIEFDIPRSTFSKWIKFGGLLHAIALSQKRK